MSRFACNSSELHLPMLMRGARAPLLVAIAGALVAHLGLTQWSGPSAERGVVRPLSVQFVKRRPRLAKPLELKKRPRPKRRSLQRQMVAAEPRVGLSLGPVRTGTLGMLESLVRRSAMVRGSGFVGGQALEPSAFAQSVRSARETEQTINTSLEMLSVDALDTGQYHAVVVQDPRDKRSVSGFFHVARAYPQTVGALEASLPYNPGSPQAVPRALPSLAEALNRWTDIRADVRGAFTFDSRELFKTPMVLVASHVTFRLTGAEALTVGRYLLAGGFLYTDTLQNLDWRANYHSIVLLWRDSLASVDMSQGRHWRFEELPTGHGIYHCYFDFDRPPIGHDDVARQVTVSYLEGVAAAGRLLGICTEKNYTVPWGRWPRLSVPRQNARQLQFGVNLIVFALTQEGSITYEVMRALD